MPPYLLPVCLWYGLLSLALLWAFSSLGHEIQRGFDATKAVEDEEAWQIVRATLHVNGIAMAIANLVAGIACYLMSSFEEGWRDYFAISILAVGMYWTYAYTCEKKLAAFLVQVEQHHHKST